MEIAKILILLMVIIYHVSFWKIFAKAGRTDKWEGFVPVYNLVVWMKVLKKPWWWTFFFFIPFVNLVVAVACNVETARMFGKYSVKDTLLTILLPWYYIPYLGYKDENVMTIATDWENEDHRNIRSFHDHITLFFMAPFVGHALLFIFKIYNGITGETRKEGKGSMEYEWTNAIGFAVVAATIIRTFFFEAFTIPTGSMEKTMRIGDYLFVNKMKYGPRSPMTIISVPFIHNRLPGTFTKSYVEWLTMDYYRLPGYGNMERGNIMVFNWPVGDSVLMHNDVIAHDYYSFVRDQALLRYYQNGGKNIKDFNENRNQYFKEARTHLINGGNLLTVYGKPDGTPGLKNRLESTKGLQTLTLDKKENYIKRNVGAPGDTLSIKQGIVYIDSKAQEMPEESQWSYHVFFKPGVNFTAPEYMSETYDVYTLGDHSDYMPIAQTPIVKNGDTVSFFFTSYLVATQEIANSMRNQNYVDSVVPQFEPKKSFDEYQYQFCPIFPNHPDFDWSRDNFGPLYIPKAGATISLTPENWIIYRRSIEVYENNEVAVKADGIYINGELATEYTFKQNYYWMMGDNRHGSVDSRYWGFIPEDHIVGTASFVWMSKHPEKTWFGGGLRWDRVFSFVH